MIPLVADSYPFEYLDGCMPSLARPTMAGDNEMSALIHYCQTGSNRDTEQPDVSRGKTMSGTYRARPELAPASPNTKQCHTGRAGSLEAVTNVGSAQSDRISAIAAWATSIASLDYSIKRLRAVTRPEPRN